MTDRKPHKWAEVIKAAADGAQVEARPDSPPDGAWREISIAMMFGMLADGGWEFRIKPTPPPLRVEDIALGFPLRLKNGRTIIPLGVDPNRILFGRSEDSWVESIAIDSVDPTSIIPTREVWFFVFPEEGQIPFNSYLEVETFSRAHKRGPGFIHGPIRIPLKPLT